MKRLLAFIAIFDWTALPRVIVETLFHADWGAARQKHGVLGLGLEAAGSIAATNTYTFFVPLDSPWGGAEIGALLRSKGITMWGAAYANGEMFFRVRRQQADWAQYVMLQAGVPLLHRLIAGERSGRQRKSPATAEKQPAPRRQRKRSAADALLDFLDDL